MTKQELVDKLASDSGLSKADIGRVLDSFIATVTGALKKNDQVALPKFGIFLARDRAARMGINPRTQEPVQIKASKAAAFKPSSNLKKQLNS